MHIYAQGRAICQLLEDEEVEYETIEVCFFSSLFSKTIMDGEERWGIVGDALSCEIAAGPVLGFRGTGLK